MMLLPVCGECSGRTWVPCRGDCKRYVCAVCSEYSAGYCWPCESDDPEPAPVTRCQSERYPVPRAGGVCRARCRFAVGWRPGTCDPDGSGWWNVLRYPNPCHQPSPGECS